MKISLRMAAMAAVVFVGFDVRPVLAQQVQCDFKKWVKDWFVGRTEARDLKDGFADAICHFTTDRYYCKASANFKSFVIRQSKNYQNTLANEVIPSQGPGFGTCILCQVRELYQTLVKNPDSIQAMCKKVGEAVANRPDLKYIYDEKMNCGFKIGQAALTDEVFDDAYWNTGSNSIRHWLSTRVIPDLISGVSDDVVGPEMTNVGSMLQPFVNKYPPAQQSQDALDSSFSGITCTAIELPPCTRPVVQCPSG